MKIVVRKFILGGTKHMEFPIDMRKPWYHGTPLELDILREGSTITQWRELAEAFSTKPTLLGYEYIFGEITHNRTETHFIRPPMVIVAVCFSYALYIRF